MLYIQTPPDDNRPGAFCWKFADFSRPLAIVPEGVGDNETEGMIAAVRYARENKVPFFGICMGMQAVVEGTNAYNAYLKEEINERHRHSYEFNNKFKDRLTGAPAVQGVCG